MCLQGAELGPLPPPSPSCSLSPAPSGLRGKTPPQAEATFWILSISPDTVISVCPWCVLPGVTGPHGPAAASPLQSYVLFREQGANSTHLEALQHELQHGRNRSTCWFSWHQTKGRPLNTTFSFLSDSAEGAGAISEKNEADPC